jgi:predicted metalloprotease with PDZ domain
VLYHQVGNEITGAMTPIKLVAVVTMAALLCMSAARTAVAADHMSIAVDARDAPRRLLHADLEIPVRPGPVTLVYPRWGITTYQSPTSVVDNIVGLKIRCGDRALRWKRDLVDPFAFNVVVPEGQRTIDVGLDIVPLEGRSDFNAATGQLLVLDWHTVFVYPRGTAVEQMLVRSRLRLPPGWHASMSDLQAVDWIEYPDMSLAALADMPVLAGKYFVSEPLPDTVPSVVVDIAGDQPGAAALPPIWKRRFSHVVDEAGALFGGQPYHSYHFQIALSDTVGNDGVEHRESTDLRMGLQSFVNDANRLAYGYLIPHEYAHAWNGKYVLPGGVVRNDFQEPQTTELLWVYEGLTRYLNWVLAARAAILSVEESRDYVALLAAKATHRSGREWRSLQDTATASVALIDSPDQWETLRRGLDYYDEALLIWLEVDTTIRRLTHGRKSLDDFCRAFFGPAAPPPAHRTYSFDDVVAALHAVTPFDWRSLLRERLDAIGADRAPLAGLTASGWTLVYGVKSGSVQAAREILQHTLEERFSIGMLLSEDGSIIDVVRDSAAWRAGLGPGMKVHSVNGQSWSAAALREAIAEDHVASGGLRLSVRNGAEDWDAEIDDHSGARYPQLRRIEGPDLMAEILRPRVLKPAGE